MPAAFWTAFSSDLTGALRWLRSAPRLLPMDGHSKEGAERSVAKNVMADLSLQRTESSNPGRAILPSSEKTGQRTQAPR